MLNFVTAGAMMNCIIGLLFCALLVALKKVAGYGRPLDGRERTRASGQVALLMSIASYAGRVQN